MRDKTLRPIKRKFRREKFMKIVPLIVLLLSISSCILSYSFNVSVDKYSKTHRVFSPEKYYDDPAVLRVSELCKDVEVKSICVFREIPFYYTNRSEDDKRKIIEPWELYIDGKGLCRDISIFRLAVFQNLGVSSSYIFEGEDHVYVVTQEGTTIFELNNQFLIEHPLTDYEFI